MSSRYGRNKRRADREEITRLELLTASQKRSIERLEKPFKEKQALREIAYCMGRELGERLRPIAE